MINIDDFTPRYVGNTGNPLTVTLTDHVINPITGKYTPYNLTGLSAMTAFKIHMKNMSTLTMIDGVGTWSIVDALNGVAQYQWNAADVASAGTFGISATVTFASGPVTFDTKILTIL